MMTVCSVLLVAFFAGFPDGARAQQAADALESVRGAAERGDAQAQLTVGLSYLNGQGVRKSKAEAEKWMKRASDQGFGPASFQMARMFAGRRDWLGASIAVDYYGRAATQGFGPGAYELGVAHSSRFSPSVHKDVVQSCTWFLVADALEKEGRWNADAPDWMMKLRELLPDRIRKARTELKPDELAQCEARAAAWVETRRTKG